LDTEGADERTVRDTFGLNNYLIYTVNDCLSYGMRFEWWNVDKDSRGYYGDEDNFGINPGTGVQFASAEEIQDAVDGSFDVYALTLGVNYRPHANVVVRPEIRWDWVDGNLDELAAADAALLEDNDDDQTTFGIDTILTF